MGGVTRDSSTTQKVYKPTGTAGFTVRTIGTLNVDYMVLPNGFSRRLGVDFFLRHQFASQNTKSRPGIGFFFLEKGSPRKITGGISFTPDKKNDVAVSLFVGKNF